MNFVDRCRELHDVFVHFHQANTHVVPFMCRFMATADEMSSYNAPRWWELHCFAFPPNSLWHGPGCPIIGSETWINMESSCQSLEMVSTRNESPYFSKTWLAKKDSFVQRLFYCPWAKGKTSFKKQKTCLSTMQYLCTKMMIVFTTIQIPLEKHPLECMKHKTCTANRGTSYKGQSIVRSLPLLANSTQSLTFFDPEAAGVENGKAQK